MLFNLRDLDSDKTMQCDICIVGAGVAGQTLAMSLAARGIDVLLCESGKHDFDPDIQTLAEGGVTNRIASRDTEVVSQSRR